MYDLKKAHLKSGFSFMYNKKLPLNGNYSFEKWWTNSEKFNTSLGGRPQ